jgi:hypothetical protein
LSAINANGKTTLTYVVDNKKADEYEETDFVTVEFTVPVICGFEASLTFTKTDDSGNILTNAFGFTLTHSPQCSCHTTDACEQIERTVNSETGEVDFGNIPSGHEYILTESYNPVPALYETANPGVVTVSYGTTAADAIIDGQFANKAITAEAAPQEPSDPIDNDDDSLSDPENDTIPGDTEPAGSDDDGTDNNDNVEQYIISTKTSLVENQTAGTAITESTTTGTATTRTTPIVTASTASKVTATTKTISTYTNTTSRINPSTIITDENLDETTEVTDETLPLDEAAQTEILESDVPVDEMQTVDTTETTESIEAEAGTVEAATPQSTMPQTGINDTIRLWIYGLCISLLGLGTMLCIINKARKED